MKRVIRFSRLRLVMALFSGAIIVTGIVSLAVKGINYGIDFRGGLNPQVQIAPVAMRLSAAGADSVVASSASSEGQILAENGLRLTVVTGQQKEEFSFTYSDHPTLSSLAQALETVPGVDAQLVAEGSISPARIFPTDLPVNIVATPLVLNHRLAPDEAPYADIEAVRAALAPLGDPAVQTLGDPAEQQFIFRVAVPTDAGLEARPALEARVKALLGTAFSPDEVLIRQMAYVSPSLAGELATQTVSVVLVALALMLVYLSFRFKFEYALATILTVIHDAAVMFTATVVLGLEFSTSVVAAILTIIGYSVNDTIVIFDRVRENVGLMRDSDETVILDTSLSQTLGRTLITSFVTLLAVVALFVFTTGSLKDFALLLIIGILVGSYSTIYIASPIVMLWHKIARRSQRKAEAKKFGTGPSKGELPSEPRVEADGAEEPAEMSGEQPAETSAEGAREPAAQGPVVRQQPTRKKKKRR